MWEIELQSLMRTVLFLFINMCSCYHQNYLKGEDSLDNGLGILNATFNVTIDSTQYKTSLYEYGT